MEIKEFSELISELNTVDVSLKQSIKKLESYNIENQLKALKVENIGKNITKKLETEVESSILKFEQKNKELDKKIEKFESATRDLIQIDNIAETLDLILKNNKKIEKKIKWLPIFITSFLVGFFTFYTTVTVADIKIDFFQIFKNENIRKL